MIWQIGVNYQFSILNEGHYDIIKTNPCNYEKFHTKNIKK